MIAAMGGRRRTGIDGIALVASLGALLVAGAGCGGASKPKAHVPATTRPSPPSSTASSGPPPLTVAQARALGARINLRPADLAGYTASTRQRDPASQRSAAEFAACAGAAPPSRRIAEVESRDFAAGAGLQTAQVSSGVTVMPSTAVVALDLAAIRSSRGRRCLSSQLSKAIASGARGGARFGAATLTVLPIPPGNTDGAFAYRLQIPGTASGLALKLYVDLIGFAAGPLQVQLQTLRLGRPFDTRLERRLYRLLLARAGAGSPRAAAVTPAPAAGSSPPRPAY